MTCPPTSSSTITSTVSSPATVPMTASQAAPIERRAYDMGRSGRRAQHHQIARVGHLDHPLPQHPAQVILRRDLVHRQLGQRVGGVAAGQPHLDCAQVLEVPRHRGLRGLHALLGQQARPAGPGW